MDCRRGVGEEVIFHSLSTAREKCRSAPAVSFKRRTVLALVCMYVCTTACYARARVCEYFCVFLCLTSLS